MYELALTNHQIRHAVDEDWLLQVAEATLTAEQVSRAEIVIAIVDDAIIHEVNRTHLNHDYPTDVISFLYSDARPGAGPAGLPRGAGLSLDGELTISADTAAGAAPVHHWTLREELALYLVHGLLHLCGYDDLTPEEQQLMRQREREILNFWNLQPHYTES
jgi:probable rRNA maturation factor